MPYFVPCLWKVPTSLLSFERITSEQKNLPLGMIHLEQAVKGRCLTLFIIEGELISSHLKETLPFFQMSLYFHPWGEDRDGFYRLL